jgi:hypothetical protein
LYCLIIKLFLLYTQFVPNKKNELLLQIIAIATEHLNCKRFKKLPPNHHIINSLLLQFKMQFVFTSKEYKRNLQMYKSGLINWEEFKTQSLKVFYSQLSGTNNKEIDSFFSFNLSQNAVFLSGCNRILNEKIA